jgi:hypothetical protein
MKTRKEVIAEIEREYETLNSEEKAEVRAYIAKLKNDKKS